jgi:hypothetical protein
VHPEYKFNGLDGQPCPRNTRGLLQRRPIHLAGPVRLIGKEANNIDNVQAGLYAQLHEIITEYVKDDHFHQQVMPLPDDLSGHKLARRVGAHPRTIHRIRAEQMPRPALGNRIIDLALHQRPVLDAVASDMLVARLLNVAGDQ